MVCIFYYSVSKFVFSQESFWKEETLPIVDDLPCACSRVDKTHGVVEEIGHLMMSSDLSDRPLRTYGGVACIHFQSGARYLHFRSVGLHVRNAYLSHTTNPDWRLWYAYRDCPSGMWALPKLVECYR